MQCYFVSKVLLEEKQVINKITISEHKHYSPPTQIKEHSVQEPFWREEGIFD